MMRGPHRYGMGRAPDGDAGGVAELQTDVMRFMAILALCLVVIFALVQSIPQPVETRIVESAPPPRHDATPPTAPAIPEPVVAPVPGAEPVPAPVPEPVRAPPPVSMATTPAPSAPSAPSAPTAPSDAGFTLQFESDAALARLVGRNVIGLYALADDATLRMSVNGSRVSFWPASLPNAYHEMDPSTVPADVTTALARTRTGDGSVTWGVTLPANMQRQLDTMLAEHDGGALYIAGDGRIRMAR